MQQIFSKSTLGDSHPNEAHGRSQIVIRNLIINYKFHIIEGSLLTVINVENMHGVQPGQMFSLKVPTARLDIGGTKP